MPLFKQTFRELAATWYYHGFTEIDLEFIESDRAEMQLEMARKIALSGPANLEGYLTTVLKRSTVPGVVEYTLTGK